MRDGPSLPAGDLALSTVSDRVNHTYLVLSLRFLKAARDNLFPSLLAMQIASESIVHSSFQRVVEDCQHSWSTPRSIL